LTCSGHALSLNLLATYSKRVLAGLLPVRKEIEDLLTDPRVSKSAFVMMRRYEILLEEQSVANDDPDIRDKADRELALLYLIGLFDRPAEAAAIAVLLNKPIDGLSSTSIKFDRISWPLAVEGLREVKLLLPETVPGEIDAHPLVREYFGERLRKAKPDAFKAANLRLYEHYKLRDIPEAFHDPVRYGLLALAGARGAEAFQRLLRALMAEQIPAEMQSKLPPALRGIAPARLQSALADLDDAAFNGALGKALPGSVKGMESLFSAIAHGCAAGAHNAAFYEVYFARVTRGNEWHATKKLGAFGADLSALAHFFEVPFATPSPNLGEADQSLILGEAAFRLRALGRFVEAEVPFCRSTDAWHIGAGLEQRCYLRRQPVRGAVGDRPGVSCGRCRA